MLAFLKLKIPEENMTAIILTCKKRRRNYELQLQSIKFTSKKVKTKEGIKIGSKEKTMKKKYGRARDNFGVYTYKKTSYEKSIIN